MDSKSQTILVVDDVAENIDILSTILKNEYNIVAAKCGKTAIKIAEKIIPDLILLDIMLPDIDGFEVCTRLKNNPLTKIIPIIFVTSKSQDVDETKGFEIGAVDYITKPVSSSVVHARVKTHLALYDQNRELEKMVASRTKEVINTRFELIKRLAMAAEYKDNETGKHIIRVGNYCKVIAMKYGFPSGEADLICDAAPMHDVGKIGVPDSILQKKGKLDLDEFQIVKTHCNIGAKLIGDHEYDLLKVAKIIAMEHHEKWDGTGYPRGLKGEKISIYARITAVADVFDALTSKRPYKEAWTVEAALSSIQKDAGKHFDTKVVEAFLKGLDEILVIKEQNADRLI